jgi:hypothetical protein
MSKKSTRNNELLNSAKDNTSPKIYNILLELVNEDRNDLAEVVLKVDYILEYASNCIRQKDFQEARETLDKAKSRMTLLKNEGANVEYLEYLYEGIAKKCKKK